MKVMVISLSLLMGAVVFPAVTADKPGYCPGLTNLCTLGGPSLNECETDQDCEGEKKCCKQCWKKCGDPLISDECPLYFFQFCPNSLNLGDCLENQDCPGEQWCCDQCGRKCVDPSITA
ncbi:perlwapin-like isoform X2 [Rana temporaria]|nr:perlwapin-like isoform X2 [Rana temporaria]